MIFREPWLAKHCLVKLELKQVNASLSWSRKGTIQLSLWEMAPNSKLRQGLLPCHAHCRGKCP